MVCAHFQRNSNRRSDEIDYAIDDIIEAENNTAEESVELSDAFPDYRHWIEGEEAEEYNHDEYKKYTKRDKLKQVCK